MAFTVIEIGCTECGNSSWVIGTYASLAEAEEHIPEWAVDNDLVVYSAVGYEIEVPSGGSAGYVAVVSGDRPRTPDIDPDVEAIQ